MVKTFTDAIIEYNEDKISYGQLLGAYKSTLGLDPNQVIMNFTMHKEFADRLRNLPVWKQMKDITKHIKKHQFLFLQAGTGSGKSTQVPPQLISKDILYSDKKIFCTQPRVATTIGIAEGVNKRVFGAKDSVFISYLTGASGNNVNRRSSLIYVTEAIIRFKLKDIYLNENETEAKRDLKEISYLCIDEVHERSKDVDFLLFYLKKVIQKYPKHSPKVIIMSATFDPKFYAKYFNVPASESIIEVPGATSIIDTTYMPDNYKPTFEQNHKEAINILSRLLQDKKSEKGDVIIFTFGALGIKRLEEYIKQYDCLVIKLDRTSIKDPKIIKLKDNPSKKTKVYLATNVVETGITIPNLKYVIDTMYEHIAYYDTVNNHPALTVTLISKNSMFQRRGRVGRISNGYYFPILCIGDVERLKDFSFPSIYLDNVDVEILELMALGYKVDEVDKLDLPSPILSSSVLNSQANFFNMSLLNGDSLTELGHFRLLFSKYSNFEVYYIMMAIKHECVYQCLKVLSMHKASPEKLNNLYVITKKKYPRMDTLEKKNVKAMSRIIFEELFDKCLEYNIPITSSTKNKIAFKEACSFVFISKGNRQFECRNNPDIKLTNIMFLSKYIYALSVIRIRESYVVGLHHQE